MPSLMNQISVLANLRIAGALIIDKDNLDFPSNPKPGTLAIVGLGLYAYITVAGVQAWYPLVQPEMGTANYLHTQVSPATTWTVVHNLNTPASETWYQIQDNNNITISAAQLIEIDNNSFQLIFNTPQNGKCVVVGTEQIIIDSATIADGTDIQIRGYANQPLHMVAGNGMTISFDDNTKSITFNASASAEAVEEALATETAARIADVDTEEASRIAGDTALATALSAEVTARELDVSNEVVDRTTAISNEASLRLAGDNAILSSLNSEVTRAINVENTIADNLIAEVTRSTTEDNRLNTTILAEVTRATGVEDTIISSLDTEVAARISGDSTNAAAIAAEVTRATSAEAALALAGGNQALDFSTKKLTVYGDILPDVTELRDIGSPTHRFRSLYVDEAHLSVNTLYLGDTPILGTDADVINIRADPGQSINVTTTGVGATLLTSNQYAELSTNGASANVVLKAIGVGSQVLVNAAQSIAFTAPTTTTHGDSVVTGSQTVVGGLTVTGNLVVNGGVTTVNSTTVTTIDNMIEVNYGQVGNGVSANLAGIVVNRGDLPKYQFVFDESVDMFRVGMVGNLETLASQPHVASLYSPLTHTHSEATSVLPGFMSSADKIKLDSIVNNVLALTDAAITSSTVTLATTTENQVVNTILASVCRSVKYIIQVTSGTQYQVSEILCIHDGTQPYITEVSNIFTGASALATFTTKLINGNLELVASPVNTNSTIKVVRTAITI